MAAVKCIQQAVDSSDNKYLGDLIPMIILML